MEVNEEFTKIDIYIDDDSRSLATTVSPEPALSEKSFDFHDNLSENFFDLQTSVEEDSLARIRRLIGGKLSYKEALVSKNRPNYESEHYDSEDGVTVTMPKINSRKIRKRLCKKGAKCLVPYCRDAHCMEHLIIDECKNAICERRNCLNYHPGDNVFIYLRKRKQYSERKKMEKLNNEMDNLFLQYAQPEKVPYLKKKLENIQNIKKKIDIHISSFKI